MSNKSSGRAARRPTYTSLVLQQLATWPADFATVKELAAAIDAKYNQVHAALHHLRQCKAVDVVIELDGTGWWYATLTDDQRSRTVEERRPEDRPRRPRRNKASLLATVAPLIPQEK